MVEVAQVYEDQRSLSGPDLPYDLINPSDSFLMVQTLAPVGPSSLTWLLLRVLTSFRLHPTPSLQRDPFIALFEVFTAFRPLTPAPQSYRFVSCIPLALFPSFCCKNWNLGMSDPDGTGLPENDLLERLEIPGEIPLREHRALAD